MSLLGSRYLNLRDLFWSMRSNQSKKEDVKRIAKERLDTLFLQARKVFQVDQTRAHRYVDLARKIQMKAKIRMPREYKRQYCIHCYSYLVSGVNGSIRVHNSKIVISCFSCKKFTRIPLTLRRRKVVAKKVKVVDGKRKDRPRRR